MSTQPITPDQAYEWLKSGEAILIDVREPEEFQSEHIAYATSVPLSFFAETVQGMSFPKDRKIIFQCMKGGRSMQACTFVQDGLLKDHTIFNLTGGISGWKEANLPVIGAAIHDGIKKAGISIFRQVQMIIGSLVAVMVIFGLMGLTFGFVIAGILGAALAFAGFTGWCGLAMLLQKMPWNK